MKKPVESDTRLLDDGRNAFALAAHILFASFGEGGVVFNLDTRESHRLNPTAARVVGLLTGRRTVGNIIDLLSRENRMNADEVKTDVEKFLKDILDRGWIDGR